MLSCDKCSVTVSGRSNVCPLCRGVLTGSPDGEDAYPIIVKKDSGFTLSMRIAGFISIAAVFVCAAVNYMTTDTLIGWWLYVAGAACSFWISFGAAMKTHGNVTKSIISTSFVCCIISLLWDLGTGFRGWSLDIVLPSVCCTALLAMAITARILSLHIEDYIYYLVMDIILGIIPLILLLCGVIDFIYPSVACIAASAISLAALFIFEGKSLLTEISRRTHL